MRPHVLLYVPLGDCDQRRWMVLGWSYCTARGYRPEAVVHDWQDAVKLWTPDTRLVVARRDHVTWLEVVSDQTEPAAASDLAYRRPRRRPEDRR